MKDKIGIVEQQYPEGHYIGLGLGIGIPLGMPIGMAMGNIALGPAMGVPIGIAIGLAMEAKATEEGKIRPLTNEEKKRKKTVLWSALGLGLFMSFIGILTYFNLGW